MSKFIVHKGGDNRWVLESKETGALIGLLLLPFPGETPHAFSYDFGSVYYASTVNNWGEFSELVAIEFFAIEYPGFYDFDRFLNSAQWQHLHNFMRAEGKVIAYNASLERKITNPMPCVWQYTPPNPAGLWKVPAYALWVNEQGCWLGNRDGLIIAFNHQGEINHQHKLPSLVRCIVGDESSIYASCNDGSIYELSGKVPREVYNARGEEYRYSYEFHIFSLDLYDHHLLLVDVFGNMTLLDTSFKVQWQQSGLPVRGLFLRSDENAIYYGHNQGVSCYNRSNGNLLWEQPTTAPVLTGILFQERVIVGCSDGQIYSLSQKGDYKTKTTEIIPLTAGDTAIYSLTISPDEQYIFVSDQQAYLYCFTITGDRLWKYITDTGAILDLKCWGKYLYGVTTNGSIICVEMSQKAITPQTSIQPKTTSENHPVNTNVLQNNKQGVIVKCFKHKNKLVVRVISSGYNPYWSVQFPAKLRSEGVSYRVEEIREAKQGGFYRAYGKIEPIE